MNYFPRINIFSPLFFDFQIRILTENVLFFFSIENQVNQIQYVSAEYVSLHHL